MASQLAASWLSQNGTGSLKDKDSKELRRVLLADLDRVLGLAGSAPPLVEEEVDQFLASGRVSDSNLHRLLRRTQARLLPGARSESGYSVHTSRTERSSRAPRAPSVGSCQSAREPREPREKERATEVMRSVPEEEMLRWSQVAKLATKEAQLEELQKKEAKKHAQEEMRSYLLHQIDVKNSKRAKAAEDERKFHEIQEAELQRWKKDQVTQAEQRLKKVQQVIRDREVPPLIPFESLTCYFVFGLGVEPLSFLLSCFLFSPRPSRRRSTRGEKRSGRRG